MNFPINRNWIYEAIATTFNNVAERQSRPKNFQRKFLGPIRAEGSDSGSDICLRGKASQPQDKKPNSAPVGFYTKNFRTIILELYKTSNTYNNIIRDGEFAINFTNNIQLFYKSSISKRGLRYLKSRKINAPILKDADGYIELRVIGIEDLGNKIRIRSEILDFKIINKKINLINRAKSLALESMINATKIPYVSDSEKKFLKQEIQNYSRIIKKVAPDSEYGKIVDNINNKIK